MRGDFDRAAEIVRLAADFDWTWSRDDLDRFCAVAHWTVTESRPRWASVTTDLDIENRQSHVHLDADSLLKYIDFGVTDRLSEEEAQSSELPAVWFRSLADRLLAELGLPNRRRETELRWDLPAVVIVARRASRDNYVAMTSPRYRAEQDRIDEDLANRPDEQW
ncbi:MULTISPECIES: DUF6301 family protein [Nocardia]|uniref:DUF6301 family protein n=1 Tax=Nocardia TaxID=1817 RepID=UPI0013003E13|nr:MULTISPECIES: DUF6301 family protein [Nocardia]